MGGSLDASSVRTASESRASRIAVPHPPHLQPDGRYQEIESADRRVACDLHDRGRHGSVALDNEEQSGQRRLRTAQDHHPLCADTLPTTHGCAELKRTGEHRPDSEHREYRVCARIQRRKYRQGRDGADRDVGRLRTVGRRPAAACQVDEIGERVPGRINDQQDRGAGRTLPPDGKRQRDPDQREYRPGKVVPFQPAAIGWGIEFGGAVDHLHSFVHRIVVPADAQWWGRYADAALTGYPGRRVSQSSGHAAIGRISDGEGSPAARTDAGIPRIDNDGRAVQAGPSFVRSGRSGSGASTSAHRSPSAAIAK